MQNAYQLKCIYIYICSLKQITLLVTMGRFEKEKIKAFEINIFERNFISKASDCIGFN